MGGRLLIVDDVATNRIVLKVKLAAVCYDTLLAENGRTALHLARTRSPDLIVLDPRLPDIDGFALIARLASDPATSDIPVIVVTPDAAAGTRLRALEAGACDVMAKPVDETLLLARMRSLMRARDQRRQLGSGEAGARPLAMAEAAAEFDRPGRIAIIEANAAQSEAWMHRLRPLLPDRIEAMSRAEALAARGDSRHADVYVIPADLRAPGEGLRLLSDLRSRDGSSTAAICIVVSADDRETAAIALDLGASDLLPREAAAEEIALRLRTQMRRKTEADRLRAAMRSQLQLALTDPLTGLHNRHFAMPQMARIAAHAAGTGRSYAVLLLDLDRFKSVNDTHGHAAGDHVLAEVAARLRGQVRAGDLLARIGGEEFLVALPDATLPSARRLAGRMCRVIEETPFDLPGGQGRIPMTVSIGIALGGGGQKGAGNPAASAGRVVDRADRALLGAKANGRNTVTVSRTAA